MGTWGFIRETEEIAKKAGIDADTGLPRTGLEKYLAKIFPDVDDWIHDQTTGLYKDGKRVKMRPDYRSEKLKLIIEIDGLPHYTNPENIIKDESNTLFYNDNGYDVVRIPYFIQLSNKAVKVLFGVEVEEQLFDESIPSMGPKGHNTPAYLCFSGIRRMAKEFQRFPEQYETNIAFLKKQENQMLVEAELLEIEYNRYKKRD